MRFPYHGAGIGLLMDGRLLIGKRSDTPFRGTWCVPGGGREQSDSDELVTAKRELREETGIDLDCLAAKPICKWTLKVPCFSWTTYFFAVDPIDIELRPHEFFELEWVPVDSVSLMDDGKKRHLRPFAKSEVRCLLKNL